MNMYTGRQFKNEVGNKVSRQVECGTRQRVRMKDERRNSVLQLFELKKYPGQKQPCNYIRKGNHACLVDKLNPENQASRAFVGDGEAHSEERLIDAMYNKTERSVTQKIVGKETLDEKKDVASIYAQEGKKTNNVFSYYKPCSGEYGPDRFNCTDLLSIVLSDQSIVWYMQPCPVKVSPQQALPQKQSMENESFLSDFEFTSDIEEILRLAELTDNKPEENPKSPWTKEEDNLLLEKVQTFGTKWNLIEPYFLNKSEGRLKNRYVFLIRHNTNSNH